MTVVKRKHAGAFKRWFERIGYQVKPLSGKGFVAKTNDRAVKKSLQYVLVTDDLGGNKAAFDLGREFENHLISPEVA